MARTLMLPSLIPTTIGTPTTATPINNSNTDNASKPLYKSQTHFSTVMSPTVTNPINNNGSSSLNYSSSAHVILPPISSFDNGNRAAINTPPPKVLLPSINNNNNNNNLNTINSPVATTANGSGNTLAFYHHDGGNNTNDILSPSPSPTLRLQRYSVPLIHSSSGVGINNINRSDNSLTTVSINTSNTSIPSIGSNPTSPIMMINHEQRIFKSGVGGTTTSGSSNSSSRSNSRGNTLSNTSTNNNKPRKKKECPICHNFYANLSTHKSTHLTPEDRPHKCPICERGFARSNDLIRHKKRHWRDELCCNNKKNNNNAVNGNLRGHNNGTGANSGNSNGNNYPLSKEQLEKLHNVKGTYKCPFNENLINLDMELYPYKNNAVAGNTTTGDMITTGVKSLPFETSNCHQTGIFSRCDTYKNHLKALHFEYPPGTKKAERPFVHGRCKHCGMKFVNVDVWLDEHVGKAGGCGYIYH